MYKQTRIILTVSPVEKAVLQRLADEAYLPLATFVRQYLLTNLAVAEKEN